MAGKIAELLRADLGARTQDHSGGDVLAKSLMGYGESDGFDHVAVAKQCLFDFGGRDLLPSSVDDVLDPPDDEQISVPVQVSEVAG